MVDVPDLLVMNPGSFVAVLSDLVLLVHESLLILLQLQVALVVVVLPQVVVSPPHEVRAVPRHVHEVRVHPGRRASGGLVVLVGHGTWRPADPLLTLLPSEVAPEVHASQRVALLIVPRQVGVHSLPEPRGIVVVQSRLLNRISVQLFLRGNVRRDRA